MRLASLLLFVPLLAAGCQHSQLRNHTTGQAATLSDLHYHQVVHNLAMFSENPDTLPYFSSAGTGQTNISQGLSADTTLSWGLFGVAGMATNWFFDRVLSRGAVSNNAVEQWTTSSSLYPEELDLMRCVYQQTVGHPGCGCEDKVLAYFDNRPCILEAMRPGWYGVGRKCDVPKDACQVAHCGKTYVWVTADNLGSLTQLTIAILDIATADPAAIASRLDTTARLANARVNRAKTLAELLRGMSEEDKKSEGARLARKELDNLLKAIAAPNAGGTTADATAVSVPLLPAIPRRTLFNPLQSLTPP